MNELNGLVIRPIIYSRVATISRARETWTLTQIEKKFNISREQARKIARKAVKIGVLSSVIDRYNRYTVLIKDYRP